MASFPNAVKSFTTKNIGDVIQPADVNDVQDEITAIEAGYINGTAPLNAANSTLANLSVTGNSTIAGNLTVTGSFIQTIPVCKVSNSTFINVNTATLTGLNWDIEDFDPQGMHSTSANSSRITFVHSTGVYLVGAMVEIGNSTAITFRLRLTLNDTTPFAIAQQDHVISANMGVTAVGPVRISSTTDYATVQVFVGGGSTLSVGQLSTSLITTFWAVKMVP